MDGDGRTPVTPDDATGRALTDLPATTVTVYPDGPLIVRGDFVVQDVDGQVLERGRSVALCRCGRSARKPLCDGSHRNAVKRRSAS